MSGKLLMPKATAVWLVENTALTFEQIAEFCGLHVLEVKGIADEDVAQGIKGMDPIASGQLSRQEIKRGQEDSTYRLKLAAPKFVIPQVTTKKGPRYTPVSRRQDRPNAILWLLRNHPELKDSQVIRLVGTTKPTITAIRERTHWNSTNLQPQDPVALGLCSQIDLDAMVTKAAQRVEHERKRTEKEMAKAGTLLPTEETTAEPADEPASAPEPEPEPEPEDGRTARPEDVAPELARAAREAMATPAIPEKAPDPDAVFASLEPDKKGGGKGDRESKGASKAETDISEAETGASKAETGASND